MKMDIGCGDGVPPVKAGLGLLGVSGGANVMDCYIIRRNKAGEVEELVDMALGCKRDHNDHHLGFVLAIIIPNFGGGFHSVPFSKFYLLSVVWMSEGLL